MRSIRLVEDRDDEKARHHGLSSRTFVTHSRATVTFHISYLFLYPLLMTLCTYTPG